MKAKRIPAVLALALAASGIASCGQSVDDRTSGEKVGMAIDSTRTAIGEAGQKTAQAVDNAANAMIETGRSAEDAAITTSIKADLLKDPELSALKIEVETNQGIVTLNGVAPSETAAERAARIATAVAGVKEVRSHVVARKG
jgi:hyperosmotically inducible protein